MARVTVESEIDLSELAYTISTEANHDQIIRFIEEIDRSVGEWEFSEKLVEYFKSLEGDVREARGK